MLITAGGLWDPFQHREMTVFLRRDDSIEFYSEKLKGKGSAIYHFIPKGFTLLLSEIAEGKYFLKKEKKQCCFRFYEIPAQFIIQWS